MLRLCIHECRETIVPEVAVSARERKNNRRDIMVTVDQGYSTRAPAYRFPG
jgi:hypothetical protein